MESIILDVYPGNKGSILCLDLDNLRFPYDVDWNSIKVKNEDKKNLDFDIVNFYNKKNYLEYSSDIVGNTLVIVLNEKSSKVMISYMRKGNKSTLKKKNDLIKIEDSDKLRIYTDKVKIELEKEFFSISKFSINNDNYASLQLFTSGGEMLSQEGSFKDAGYTIIADSHILKVIKITGKMPVRGDKVDSEGLLPLEMFYYFWVIDGEIYSKVEIKLLYEACVDLSGKKLNYLQSLLWYRIEERENLEYNDMLQNNMNGNKIIILKRPYYAYITKKDSVFVMSPYLALPNDGIHIEVSEEWFGASWHSMSSQKKPYWDGLIDDKPVSEHQGYYPAHSLNAYFNIGLYFGKKNFFDAAKAFTYQCKVRNVAYNGRDKGNVFVTHWRNNSALALNVITDDAKPNDLYWRKNGYIPLSAETALSTRFLFGVSYSRYCFLKDKLFYLEKSALLSNIVCTFLSFFRIAKDYKKEFLELNVIPHLNTHPVTRNISASALKKEIKISEKIWVKDYKLKLPLSHVFSYQSCYGLSTPSGTRHTVAFKASESLEWIRDWPIPNAPTDFFLPTKLFWGISAGGELERKNVITRIRFEFDQLYKEGADYMQVSGHLPDKICKGPEDLKKLFKHMDKKGVWLARSDDIIRYYKCREGISFSRIKDNIVEIKKSFEDKFNTIITISCDSNKVEQSIDSRKWVEAENVSEGLFNINTENNYLKFS